jgi:hypothetical protein
MFTCEGAGYAVERPSDATEQRVELDEAEHERLVADVVDDVIAAVNERRPSDPEVPVSMRWATPVVLGGLDAGDVRAVEERHMSQVRECYAREIAQQPSLRGQVNIRWFIGLDGMPRSSSLSGNTVPSDAFADCLIAKARTWRFSRPSRLDSTGVAIVVDALAVGGG